MPDDVLRVQPKGLLPDNAILGLCLSQRMIAPYNTRLVREVGEKKVVSYGVSSYGYDLRLSPSDFRVFRHRPGKMVDPKNFNPDFLEVSELQTDPDGSEYFILPGNSYALGVTLERITMPHNVTAFCLGKSTYARCGIIANATPIEASWIGHITLEFSNSSPSDAKIYANEGVIQLLFFDSEPCNTTYDQRKGKYQDQGEGVTIARI